MKYWFLILLALPAFALDGRFAGTVKLSNCSGFVAQLPKHNDADRAWVLSNGHCERGFLGSMLVKPGEALVNRKKSRELQLVTSSGGLVSTRSTRLLYATMTGTDLAVYELKETYRELKARGVLPFLISEPPRVLDGVDVVSAYRERIFSCSIDEILTGTREGGYSFVSPLRLTSECTNSDGTSGSPVVLAGTRHVLAISNSYNKQGLECTDNNPCELDANGVVEVRRGARYAQQILPLVECVEKGELKISLPGCRLTGTGLLSR